MRAESALATHRACFAHLTPQSKHPGTKPCRRRLSAPSPRIDLGAKRLTPLCTHLYGGAVRERTATHRSARRAGYTVRRRGSRFGGIPDARAYRTPCRTRRTAGVTPGLSPRSAARHEDPKTASPDGCAKRTEDGPQPFPWRFSGGVPAVGDGLERQQWSRTDKILSNEIENCNNKTRHLRKKLCKSS